MYNGVSVTGDVVGTTVLIGRGAGQDATSSSVISDIADAIFMLHGAVTPAISKEEAIYQKIANNLKLTEKHSLEGCYYIRIHVKNQEGVLAMISDIMAGEHISFATVNQKELEDSTAKVMVTTHKTNEAAIVRAKAMLKTEETVISEPFSIRIFDSGNI